MDFKNKTVIITGAANGLGKSLAKALHRCNAHLALLDHDITALQQLKSEFQQSEQRISFHSCDVSKEEQVNLVKQEILSYHDSVSMLINNAGVSISQNFEHLSLQDFRWLFETNFWGTVYCCKQFLPLLQLQTESAIVNVISSFAFTGFPGKTAYGSSKAAIAGFTNSLYTELSQSHTKIHLVIPPAIKTQIINRGKHQSKEKQQNENSYLFKYGFSSDYVAHELLQKLQQGRYRIVIGRQMFWLDLASRLFPVFLLKQIISRKRKFDFI